MAVATFRTNRPLTLGAELFYIRQMTEQTAIRPVVLCILDGWGHREAADANAIALARAPNWRRLSETCPQTLIETSGLALPKPLIKAFNWPEISTRVTVDGVVAVVDGVGLEELARLVGHHGRQFVALLRWQRQVFELLALRLEALSQAVEELVAHRLAAARVDAVERCGDLGRQVSDQVDVGVLRTIDDREVGLEQLAFEVAVGGFWVAHLTQLRLARCRLATVL